jgi:hypothetical protein
MCNRHNRRAIYGHIDFLGKGATTVLEDVSVCFSFHRALSSYSDPPTQSKWATKIEDFSDLTVFAISDVRLDNERTMKGLQKMFQSCVGGDFIPKVFILCGNFSSKNVTTDLEMDAYRGLSLPHLSILCTGINLRSQTTSPPLAISSFPFPASTTIATSCLSQDLTTHGHLTSSLVGQSLPPLLNASRTKLPMPSSAQIRVE